MKDLPTKISFVHNPEEGSGFAESEAALLRFLGCVESIEKFLSIFEEFLPSLL